MFGNQKKSKAQNLVQAMIQSVCPLFLIREPSVKIKTNFS